MHLLFYHAGREALGASRVFLSAARGLASRGHTVAFAAPDASEVARQAHRNGVPLASVVADEFWGTAVRRLAAHLRTLSTDVICVHTEREHLLAAAAARLAGKSAIVRRLQLEAPSPTRVGRIASQAGAWLSPSVYLVPTGSTSWNGHVVRAAVPPLHLELGTPIPTDRVRSTGAIACIASRSAKGRVARALRAFGLLRARHPELEFRFIGSATRNDHVRLHAAALDVAEASHWIAAGDDAGREGALRDVAAGVIAADGEEAAYGSLDLMARGVPIVAEASPLLERYVVSGIYGVLLQERDPAPMAAELAVLIADEARRKAMGQAARARVERMFTERAFLDGFEEAVRVAANLSSGGKK